MDDEISFVCERIGNIRGLVIVEPKDTFLTGTGRHWLSSFSTLVQRLNRQFASGLHQQYGDFLDTPDLPTPEGRLGTTPFDER